MVQPSIQIRRINDKVVRYFQRFGYRTHSKISERVAVISANKVLGPDLYGCRVAETARGTAVSFYSINSWTNFTLFIPFVFILGLFGLNLWDATKEFISGSNSPFGINLFQLFAGSFNGDPLSFIVILAIPTLLSATFYAIQSIRLSILKQRFAFFTKDAIWEPRDLSPYIISVRASATAFVHAWFVAIIYYSLFAFPEHIIDDVQNIYGVQLNDLTVAMDTGFSLIIGLIAGLVAGQKALLIRTEQSRYDSRLKNTGSYFERKLDPILYGIQTGLVAGALILPFLSVTFITTAPFTNASFSVIGLALGGAISGSIYEEGPLWFAGSYIASLFFISIALVFRTGQEPAMAFVVMVILFLIFVPLFLVAPMNFDYVLKKYKIKSVDYYYDYSPINPLWTVYQTISRRREAIQAYKESLTEEHVITESGVLQIDRKYLLKKGEKAELVAKHYFELLARYNAMFDEDELVLVPTTPQLIEWWADKTGRRNYDSQIKFLEFVDRLLWDPTFFPSSTELDKQERVGMNMIVLLES